MERCYFIIFFYVLCSIKFYCFSWILLFFTYSIRKWVISRLESWYPGRDDPDPGPGRVFEIIPVPVPAGFKVIPARYRPGCKWSSRSGTDHDLVKDSYLVTLASKKRLDRHVLIRDLNFPEITWPDTSTSVELHRKFINLLMTENGTHPANK